MSIWLTLASLAGCTEAERPWTGTAPDAVFLSVPEAAALIGQGASVVDARGAGPWKAGHIEGSGPVDWLDLRDSRGREGRLSEDLGKLEAAFEKAGVRDAVPVVVVGKGDDGWGEEGRIFWTLEYLGHEHVYLLDGGMPAWTSAGQPMVQSHLPASGAFTPKPRPELRKTADQVAQGGAVIWDTRTAEEYAGATPYGEKRGGHIPGAKALHYKDLTGADGTLLAEDALSATLSSAGIPDAEPVVTLCTGGVRAGFAYAVLRELGHPAPAVYDGSMWEWSADPERPLE